MTYRERMQTAYDRIASEYAVGNAAMPAELAVWAAGFLSRIGPAPAILEVGCGPGRDMVSLAERGAKVTGVDLSFGMLAEASRVVPGRVAQMDKRRLAIKANSFDGVWCMAALLHLPKASVPVALGEMRRVLASGGALALGVQEGEGEGWERGVRCGASVERFFARYSMDDVEELLREAGFKVLEKQRNPAGLRTWMLFLAALQH